MIMALVLAGCVLLVAALVYIAIEWPMVMADAAAAFGGIPLSAFAGDEQETWAPTSLEGETTDQH
jgi:hypothetical protein